MPEDTLIPARNNIQTAPGLPSEKVLRERASTIIPPRNIQQQTQEQEPPFKPKLSKSQFGIELAFVIIFFDLVPLGITFFDLTGVLAILGEATKWFLDVIAWLTIMARALFLGVTLIDKKKVWGSIAKITIPGLLELIPILNALIPGWSVQYALTFIPVTFDLQKIVKRGGTWAKYLAFIPGIGPETAVALKVAGKATQK